MAGLLTEKIRESQKRKGLLDLWSGLLGDASDTASKAESKLYDRSLIYKSLKDAVTAPGRAYKGELDPWSQGAVEEAMNVAGMATLGGFPGGARGPGSVGATVWHGSPHKFSKFDMSKIGTGEGAQAYGHGLYMAESPDVAKSYADELGQLEILHNNKVVGVFDKDPAANAAHQIRATGGDIDKAIKRAQNIYTGAWRDNVVNEIKKLGPGEVSERVNGSMYKVDIPDESIPRMLDWDKPLSEQSQLVQDVAKQWNNGTLPRKGMSGDELLRYIEQQNRFTQSGKKAEDVLRESGIPGIRYLDGGSRNAGQGTSNYVLFDDQIPRILERNGEPTGLQPWAPGEANSLLGIQSAPMRPRNALGKGLHDRDLPEVRQAYEEMLMHGPRPTNYMGQPIKPTEYEINHAIATHNQTVPVEQGGLGLPEGNTAMDRARAMGFKDATDLNKDAPHKYWLHGSPGDEITEVNPYATGGKNYTDNLDVGSMFTTSSPGEAEFYARGGSKNTQGYKYALERGMSPHIYELLISGRYRTNPGKSYVGDGNVANFTTRGRETEWAVPAKPNQVRSRFAAFDPMKRNSSDLLAGLYPWAVPLSAGLLGSLSLLPSDAEAR